MESWKRLANTLGYATFIVLNILSNALPIAGRTNADVSNRYPSLFTPAGWAFSIWGLIFAWLGAATIYMWLPTRSRLDKAAHQRLEAMGYWLVGAYLLTSGWLPAFQYLEIELSLALMFAILLSLAFAYSRVHEPAALHPPKLLSRTHWLVEGPVSIFFGWIIVATVANWFIFTLDRDWTTGSGRDGDATLFACILVTLVGAAFLLFFSDWIVPLVVAFALFAVEDKQTGAYPDGFLALPWTLVGVTVAYVVITVMKDPSGIHGLQQHEMLQLDADPHQQMPHDRDVEGGRGHHHQGL